MNPTPSLKGLTLGAAPLKDERLSTMTTRRLGFALTLALLASSLPAFATCGGGGGGGNGGAVPGLGGEPTVYRVAWKVLSPGAEKPQAPLTVYWFPTSPDEARSSPLQTSRALSQAGSRCVPMAIVTSDNQTLRETFKAVPGQPLVVIAAADGSDLGRVAGSGGKLDVRAVEKLLDKGLDSREAALDALLQSGRRRRRRPITTAPSPTISRSGSSAASSPSSARRPPRGSRSWE